MNEYKLKNRDPIKSYQIRNEKRYYNSYDPPNYLRLCTQLII